MQTDYQLPCAPPGSAPPGGCASAWNVVGLPLLPVFIVIGMLCGAWRGVQVWCWNIIHSKPGDWTCRLPK